MEDDNFDEYEDDDEDYYEDYYEGDNECNECGKEIDSDKSLCDGCQEDLDKKNKEVSKLLNGWEEILK